MMECLQHIKQIADNPAFSGCSVSDQDLVIHILSSLSHESDPFSTSVRVQSQSVTSDELHSLLLSEKVILSAKHLQLVSPEPPPQAYNIYSHNNSSSSRNQFTRGRNNSGFWGGRFNPRGGGFSRGGSYNFNYNHQNHFNTVQDQLSSSAQPPQASQHFSPKAMVSCQVCGRANHTAVDCFFFFYQQTNLHVMHIYKGYKDQKS